MQRGQRVEPIYQKLNDPAGRLLYPTCLSVIFVGHTNVLTLSAYYSWVVMLCVTARIKLLKTEEGGRTSCVRSGYRPNIRFGDLYTDGALIFLDHQQVCPGDKCEVRVAFANPDYARAYFRIGACFDIMEGSRKVGEGVILAILEDQDQMAHSGFAPKIRSVR